MNLPFNVKRMIDTELHYPQRFTSMTAKDYGMLFWNEGNKQSCESNHAVITDFIGVESSLRDIEFFYKGKGINPCLYPSFQAGEQEKLALALEHHGFSVIPRPDRFFLHDRDSQLSPVPELRIERVRVLDIELMETIAVEFGGDWTIKAVERHLLHPSYHLLGGYRGDELVSFASISIFAGYSRVDDVFTRSRFRGQGNAGGMIHYLVEYHKKLSNNYLYLYSSHPEAIKLYQKAGFSEVAPELQSWVASKTQ